MKKIVCHGCKFFYISHRIERPWGCKKFGFISKILPFREVFNTTGTECAYRTERKVVNKRGKL